MTGRRRATLVRGQVSINQLAELEGRKCVYLPRSKVVCFWSVLSLLVSVWYVVVTPYMSCVVTDDFHVGAIILTSWACDVVMLVALLFRALTFGSLGQDAVLTPRGICARYTRTPRFWVDVVSLVPLELAVLFIGGVSTRVVFAARLLKLLHLYSLFQELRSVSDCIRKRIDHDTTSATSGISSPMIQGLARLALVFILVVHLCACAVYLLGERLSHGGHLSWLDGVTVKWGSLSNTPDIKQYTYALYYALATSTAVGYGDLVPAHFTEVLFAILVMTLGLIMLAGVVANLVPLIAERTDALHHYRVRTKTIHRFLASTRVPPKCAVRALQYHSYLWQAQRGVNEAEILSRDLRPSLRGQVVMHVAGHILSQVPFLRGYSKGFLRALCLYMDPQLYCPGQNVVRSGLPHMQLCVMTRGLAIGLWDRGSDAHPHRRETRYHTIDPIDRVMSFREATDDSFYVMEGECYGHECLQLAFVLYKQGKLRTVRFWREIDARKRMLRSSASQAGGRLVADSLAGDTLRVVLPPSMKNGDGTHPPTDSLQDDALCFDVADALDARVDARNALASVASNASKEQRRGLMGLMRGTKNRASFVTSSRRRSFAGPPQTAEAHSGHSGASGGAHRPGKVDDTDEKAAPPPPPPSGPEIPAPLQMISVSGKKPAPKRKISSTPRIQVKQPSGRSSIILVGSESQAWENMSSLKAAQRQTIKDDCKDQLPNFPNRMLRARTASDHQLNTTKPGVLQLEGQAEQRLARDLRPIYSISAHINFVQVYSVSYATLFGLVMQFPDMNAMLTNRLCTDACEQNRKNRETRVQRLRELRAVRKAHERANMAVNTPLANPNEDENQDESTTVDHPDTSGGIIVDNGVVEVTASVLDTTLGEPVLFGGSPVRARSHRQPADDRKFTPPPPPPPPAAPPADSDDEYFHFVRTGSFDAVAEEDFDEGTFTHAISGEGDSQPTDTSDGIITSHGINPSSERVVADSGARMDEKHLTVDGSGDHNDVVALEWDHPTLEEASVSDVRLQNPLTHSTDSAAGVTHQETNTVTVHSHTENSEPSSALFPEGGGDANDDGNRTPEQFAEEWAVDGDTAGPDGTDGHASVGDGSSVDDPVLGLSEVERVPEKFSLDEVETPVIADEPSVNTSRAESDDSTVYSDASEEEMEFDVRNMETAEKFTDALEEKEQTLPNGGKNAAVSVELDADVDRWVHPEPADDRMLFQGRCGMFLKRLARYADEDSMLRRVHEEQKSPSDGGVIAIVDSDKVVRDAGVLVWGVQRKADGEDEYSDSTDNCSDSDEAEPNLERSLTASLIARRLESSTSFDADAYSDSSEEEEPKPKKPERKLYLSPEENGEYDEETDDLFDSDEEPDHEINRPVEKFDMNEVSQMKLVDSDEDPDHEINRPLEKFEMAEVLERKLVDPDEDADHEINRPVEKFDMNEVSDKKLVDPDENSDHEINRPVEKFNLSDVEEEEVMVVVPPAAPPKIPAPSIDIPPVTIDDAAESDVDSSDDSEDSPGTAPRPRPRHMVGFSISSPRKVAASSRRVSKRPVRPGRASVIQISSLNPASPDKTPHMTFTQTPLRRKRSRSRSGKHASILAGDGANDEVRIAKRLYKWRDISWETRAARAALIIALAGMMYSMFINPFRICFLKPYDAAHVTVSDITLLTLGYGFELFFLAEFLMRIYRRHCFARIYRQFDEIEAERSPGSRQRSLMSMGSPVGRRRAVSVNIASGFTSTSLAGASESSAPQELAATDRFEQMEDSMQAVPFRWILPVEDGYFYEYLLWDLIALLPVDLLVHCGLISDQWLYVLLLNRLARCPGRLMVSIRLVFLPMKTLFKCILAHPPIDSLMVGKQEGKRASTAMKGRAALHRVLYTARAVSWVSTLQLTLFLGLFLHIFACIWYILGRVDDGDNAVELANAPAGAVWSWIANDNDLIHAAGHFEKYLRSLYFIMLTSVTVGFGDIQAYRLHEIVFVICFMAFGVFLYLGALAYLTVLASNAGYLSNEYQLRLETAKMLLRTAKVPLPVRVRVANLYRHSWMQQYGVPHHLLETSQFLPLELRRDLHESTCRSLNAGDQCSMFQGLPPSARALLLQQSRLVTCVENDVILHGRVLAGYAYILRSGKVERRSVDTDTVLERIEDVRGAVLGGELLVGKPLKDFYYRAASLCELLEVSVASFEAILAHYPGLYLSLRNQRVPQKEEAMANIYTSTGEVDDDLRLRLEAQGASNDYDQSGLPWHKRVIRPLVRGRILWEMLCIVAMVYFAVLAPFRFGFAEVPISDDGRGNHDNNWATLSLIPDSVFDFIQVIDAYLRGRHFAQQVIGGRLETQADIWARERTFRFWVDMSASLPWDLALWAAGVFDDRVLFGLRCIRLLRLFRFPAMLASVQVHLEKHGIRLPPMLMSMLGQFGKLLVIAHWLACVWYFIADQEDDPIESWTYSQENPVVFLSAELPNRYAQSLYFVVVTMSTVGYGDMTPSTMWETIFGVVVMSVGGVVYGTVTAEIAAIAANFDLTTEAFQHYTDTLRTYFTRNDVAEKDRRRVMGHYRELWGFSKGVEVPERMLDLSRPLRQCVYGAIYKAQLMDFSLFDGLSQPCIDHIASKLQVFYFLERDVVIGQGEVHPWMYLVVNGTCETLRSEPVAMSDSPEDYYRRQGLALQQVHARRGAASGRDVHAKRRMGVYLAFPVGSSFGEPNVLPGNELSPTKQTVVSQRQSMLFGLHRTDFAEIMGVYFMDAPVLRARLETSIGTRQRIISTLSDMQQKTQGRRPSRNIIQRHSELEEADLNQNLLAWVKRKDDKFRIVWGAISCLICLVLVVIMPAHFVFLREEDQEDPSSSFYLAYIFIAVSAACDLWMLVDFYMRSRRWVFAVGDLLVMEPRRITRHFFRKERLFWVVIDIIATLPVDWFLYLVPSIAFKTIAGVRFIKILHLVKAPEYYEGLTKLLERLCVRRLSYQSRRVVKLILGVAVGVHLASCGWYGIGFLENSEVKQLVTNRGASETTSWFLLKSDVLSEQGRSGMYLYSLYWVWTTVTTCGYGDISATNSAEIAFALLVILVGNIFYAAIIGFITVQTAQKNADLAVNSQRLARLQQYMAHQRLPGWLVTRISRYHLHNACTQSIGADIEAFARIPQYLREPVKVDLFASLFENQPDNTSWGRLVSTHFPRSVLAKLCDALQSRVYLSAEALCREGDMSGSLWVIWEGSVAVMVTKQELRTGLSARRIHGVAGTSMGELGNMPMLNMQRAGKSQTTHFVGEIGFFYDSPRTATVQALNSTQTLTLSKAAWCALVGRYPLVTLDRFWHAVDEWCVRQYGSCNNFHQARQAYLRTAVKRAFRKMLFLRGSTASTDSDNDSSDGGDSGGGSDGGGGALSNARSLSSDSSDSPYSDAAADKGTALPVSKPQAVTQQDEASTDRSESRVGHLSVHSNANASTTESVDSAHSRTDGEAHMRSSRVVLHASNPEDVHQTDLTHAEKSRADNTGEVSATDRNRSERPGDKHGDSEEHRSPGDHGIGTDNLPSPRSLPRAAVSTRDGGDNLPSDSPERVPLDPVNDMKHMSKVSKTGGTDPSSFMQMQTRSYFGEAGERTSASPRFPRHKMHVDTTTPVPLSVDVPPDIDSMPSALPTRSKLTAKPREPTSICHTSPVALPDVDLLIRSDTPPSSRSSGRAGAQSPGWTPPRRGIVPLTKQNLRRSPFSVVRQALDSPRSRDPRLSVLASPALLDGPSDTSAVRVTRGLRIHTPRSTVSDHRLEEPLHVSPPASPRRPNDSGGMVFEPMDEQVDWSAVLKHNRDLAKKRQQQQQHHQQQQQQQSSANLRTTWHAPRSAALNTKPNASPSNSGKPEGKRKRATGALSVSFSPHGDVHFEVDSVASSRSSVRLPPPPFGGRPLPESESASPSPSRFAGVLPSLNQTIRQEERASPMRVPPLPRATVNVQRVDPAVPRDLFGRSVGPKPLFASPEDYLDTLSVTSTVGSARPVPFGQRVSPAKRKKKKKKRKSRGGVLQL